MWLAGGGCCWWEWVESMGVVSRRWMWVESIDVVSGCGCKEVYRFPHIYIYITYPFSSYICSFFAATSLLLVH